MQYYFRVAIGQEVMTHALVSQFSEADAELLRDSSGAVVVSQYMGEDGLKVINAKTILSVVAMVPYPHTHLGPGIWYFLVEKMGLAIFGYRGDEDPDEVVPQEQAQEQYN